MDVIRNASALTKQVDFYKSKHKRIGFAPTMGALHEGHRSLLAASKQQTDVTICSIFVNPAQFNDPKDYKKYPVMLDHDLAILESAGIDIAFAPSVEEMYPDGLDNLEHYAIGPLENILEGKYRPGHFQGVCQIMARLLRLTRPNVLFMGQKDFQQCMVINKLLSLMKAELTTLLQICPTVREPDGLAMSSRNLRLSEAERKTAAAISESLQLVRTQIRPGNLTTLEIQASSFLSSRGFKVDYFEIATADKLELLNEWDGTEKLVALAAAFLNQVRLIDNMMID